MTAPASNARRLVWDMVLPIAPVVGNTFDLLERFAAAGHAYVSLTVAGDDSGLGEAVHRLARFRAELARLPGIVLVREVADVTRAYAEGRLAVGLHLEGTECLERDPDVLDLFYELGVRHAILAFNQNNSAAGGCADLGDVGLTRLGRRYLDRMRALGMLLDVSHMSERSAREAIAHIDRPAVATHSNARAVHDHYRNLSDDLVRTIAASGGLVGLSGSSVYLGPGDLAERAFHHIDHLVSLVGPEHVGLGTDYVADGEALARLFADRPDEWPTDQFAFGDRLEYLPPERLAEVTGRMERAGYREDAVDAILGGNYLRIASEVWR